MRANKFSGNNYQSQPYLMYNLQCITFLNYNFQQNENNYWWIRKMFLSNVSQNLIQRKKISKIFIFLFNHEICKTELLMNYINIL